MSEDPPDRLCPSFSGPAAEKWHRIRERHKDENGKRPTDSELLTTVLERLDDPWEVALDHYDDFTDQAFSCEGVGRSEYDFFVFLRSVIIQVRAGLVDPAEATDELQELTRVDLDASVPDDEPEQERQP